MKHKWAYTFLFLDSYIFDRFHLAHSVTISLHKKIFKYIMKINVACSIRLYSTIRFDSHYWWKMISRKCSPYSLMRQFSWLFAMRHMFYTKQLLFHHGEVIHELFVGFRLPRHDNFVHPSVTGRHSLLFHLDRIAIVVSQ